MVKITEEIKQKILNDPVLDTKGAIQKTGWLIANLMSLLYKERCSKLLTDEELKVVESSQLQLDNDFEKVIQAIRNSEIDLTDLIIYEKKKRESLISRSRKLKERVLNSLSEWTVIGGTKYNVSGSIPFWNNISEGDEQEIKRNIFELIKQNSSEWTLKKILVSNGKGIGGCSWSELLVHKSFRVGYDEYGELSYKYREVHWKSGFTSDQEAELEQIFQAQSRTLPLEPQKIYQFLFFVVLMVSISLVVLFCVKKKSRSQKRIV
ncbi:hypothetical protein [endosymbiont GvMRE of Glomus versiforme]|uniref:hypothetical protein n=1 Tax=endosymbiont GvMRE of Glomus versiforme TaxID=2039283 RepID=UPI000EE21F84|nr:hypothetical protein [endosymbiont GvMRE of Glomus versiforme]RHZ35282.1 hypothetical protein GvMRE_IIg131 [endosymbiont GvMRE of Glomus versiforme]